MSGITIDKSKATTPLPSCDVYSHLAPKKCQKPEQKECRGGTGIMHTSAILNYAMSYLVFSGEVKKLV